MGRIFAILLIVLMIWVGLELYLEGPRGAFASLMAEPNTPGLDRQLSAPKRAGAAVNRAYRETEKRYDKMLDQ